VRAEGDLLLIGSGSGRTPTLVAHAEMVASLVCGVRPLWLDSQSHSDDEVAVAAAVALTPSSCVALITADASAPLAAIARATGGAVVRLPAPTPKAMTQPEASSANSNSNSNSSASSAVLLSAQPMASLFEQTMALVSDALVLELMDRTGQSTDTMFARHANLE
jgi:6-phospho-3-hexuloisomerase